MKRMMIYNNDGEEADAEYVGRYVSIFDNDIFSGFIRVEEVCDWSRRRTPGLDACIYVWGCMMFGCLTSSNHLHSS